MRIFLKKHCYLIEYSRIMIHTLNVWASYKLIVYFIKSQDVKENLTHVLHKEEDFDKMAKEGIKITQLNHYMLWKPQAFWISMDYDWERWCTGENFGDMEKSTICDITLKNDLKLLKITNVKEAEELGKLLLPEEIPSISRGIFGHEVRFSDMITLTIYQTEKMKQGHLIGPEFWDPVTKNYDGIYFLNSGSLHFETFFNTWDAHSIALFDGKNCTLSNPHSGKEIINFCKQ